MAQIEKFPPPDGPFHGIDPPGGLSLGFWVLLCLVLIWFLANSTERPF